jgi:hypothetical protein
MRRARSCLIAIVAVFSASCDFVSDHHIDGPYRLVTLDLYEDSSICYSSDDNGCVGRGPSSVFATAFNSSYIVAASSPSGDRSKVEFFYIDRALDGPHVDSSVSVKGPFTPETFALERARLGLPEPR